MPERDEVYPEVCGTCKCCVWVYDQKSEVAKTICKHYSETMIDSYPIMVVTDAFLHVCDEYKARRFTAKKGKAVADVQSN